MDLASSIRPPEKGGVLRLLLQHVRRWITMRYGRLNAFSPTLGLLTSASARILLPSVPADVQIDPSFTKIRSISTRAFGKRCLSSSPNIQ